MAAKEVSESLFDSLSLHLMYYSNFVNWGGKNIFIPINVDFRNRTASSAAGIAFIVCNENSENSPLVHATEFDHKKSVNFGLYKEKKRILIVASDGNFLAVVA